MRVIAIAFTYPRRQLQSSAADVLIDRLAVLSMRLSQHEKILISVPDE